MLDRCVNVVNAKQKNLKLVPFKFEAPAFPCETQGPNSDTQIRDSLLRVLRQRKLHEMAVFHERELNEIRERHEREARERCERRERESRKLCEEYERMDKQRIKY
jgi:hypothetical protein